MASPKTDTSTALPADAKPNGKADGKSDLKNGKKADKKAAEPATPPAPSGPLTPAAILLWTMGTLLWILVVASVLSHDPLDGPLANSSEGVLNPVAKNWIG